MSFLEGMAFNWPLLPTVDAAAAAAGGGGGGAPAVCLLITVDCKKWWRKETIRHMTKQDNAMRVLSNEKI